MPEELRKKIDYNVISLSESFGGQNNGKICSDTC